MKPGHVSSSRPQVILVIDSFVPPMPVACLRYMMKTEKASEPTCGTAQDAS